MKLNAAYANFYQTVAGGGPGTIEQEDDAKRPRISPKNIPRSFQGVCSKAGTDNNKITKRAWTLDCLRGAMEIEKKKKLLWTASVRQSRGGERIL